MAKGNKKVVEEKKVIKENKYCEVYKVVSIIDEYLISKVFLIWLQGVLWRKHLFCYMLIKGENTKIKIVRECNNNGMKRKK